MSNNESNNEYDPYKSGTPSVPTPGPDVHGGQVVINTPQGQITGQNYGEGGISTPNGVIYPNQQS